ncbi:MAG: hypothetical protein ACM3UU_01125 [Ignavibacteriales bacterium]
MSSMPAGLASLVFRSTYAFLIRRAGIARERLFNAISELRMLSKELQENPIAIDQSGYAEHCFNLLLEEAYEALNHLLTIEQALNPMSLYGKNKQRVLRQIMKFGSSYELEKELDHVEEEIENIFLKTNTSD